MRVRRRVGCQFRQAVKLFDVRKDPALTADELMNYCREQFTGYKKPKYIEFRDDLPKTNVGKILRRELRDKEKSVRPQKNVLANGGKFFAIMPRGSSPADRYSLGFM